MNMEEIKNRLEEDGYCVVPNILTEEECSQMNDEMWTTLEHVLKNRIQRENESSWREFFELVPKHSMLLQNWSFGHAQYIWNLRQHPKVTSLFRDLWNLPSSEDLIVSFDGTSIHLPPEITGRGWREKARSVDFHCDQSFLRNDLETYQSWITANDINEHDGTLMVLKGSHRLHREFGQRPKFTRSKDIKKAMINDWYKLEETDVHWYEERGCESVFVQCPKGSLVLWDSRTIHSGVQPSRKREKANLRNIVYLCYVPRSMATHQKLQERIRWFENMDMTSHSPHNGRKFPKTPRLYGPRPDVENIPRPVLNALRRRLVGYDE